MPEREDTQEQLISPESELRGHSAWVELSRPSIEYNWKSIQGIVGSDITIIPMLKANAYGHGAVQVGKVLQEAGAKYAGVSSLGEALELRNNGITIPLLVTDYIDPEVLPIALDLNIAFTVSHPQMFYELEAAATASGKKARVHLFVDTGMHREGIWPVDETVKQLTDKKVEFVKIPDCGIIGAAKLVS